MDQVTQAISAVDQWRALGLRELELPSGAAVRLRLPNVARMLRDGTMPAELEGMVLRYTQGSIRVSELSREELDGFVGMRDQAVVQAVEQLRIGDQWQPIDLRPFLLDLEIVLPIEDLDRIGLAVLRHQPIEILNARTRGERAALATLDVIGADDVADPDDQMIGGPTAIPAAGDFRRMGDDAGGSTARTDGAELRAAAE